MTRTPLSYDDVAQACDRLLSKGIEPSLRLVRQEIGRGSLTTIHEFMVSRRDLQRQPPEPTSEAMRALETLAPAAALQVRDAYRQAMAEEKAALAQHIEQQGRTISELSAALRSVEEERDSTAERLLVTQIRADAVDKIQDGLAALLPVLSGQLDAHTSHLSTLVESYRDENRAAQRTFTHQLLTVHEEVTRTAENTGAQRAVLATIEQAHHDHAHRLERALELTNAITQQITTLTLALETNRDHRQHQQDQHVADVNRRLAHLQSRFDRLLRQMPRKKT